MTSRGTGAARRRAIIIATTLAVAGLPAPASSAAKPDLVVSALRNPPAFAEPGQKVTIRDTVKNKGGRAAPSSVVRYLLSRDGKAGSGDQKIGRRRVGRLGPGKSSVGNVRSTVPESMPPGIYYLLACADGDNDVAESSEKNNCRKSATWVLVDSGLLVTPNPLNVQRSLASAQSVSEDVDASVGGTVETTGPDGTTYKLDIPPHALYGDTEIGMTPVDSITGVEEYMDGGIEVAVELKPEGLRLYKPATLTIDPPTALPAGTDDGFSYEGAGESFHLYPLNIDSPGVALDLLHFSAYGIGGGADRDALGDFEPESVEGQNEAEVSDIAERFKNGEIDWDQFLAEFSSVMVRQYVRAVVPALAAAQSGEADHDLGLKALDVFIYWKLELELMELGDYLNEHYQVNMSTLIDHGSSQVRGIAKTLFDKAWGRCRRNVNRQTNFDIMAYWARMAELSLGGGEKVLGADWQEKVYRCRDPKVILGEVRFESIWNAEMDTRLSNGVTKTIHREMTGILDVSFVKGDVVGGERRWVDNGSTVDASYEMTAEGTHHYTPPCAFTEEQSFDRSGTISDMALAGIEFHFDPNNQGWYTDNAALSLAVTVNDALFKHQDATSSVTCGHDNHSTLLNATLEAPTCPIQPVPDRPAGGMRGVFSNKGGVLSLDFTCSGTTTYEASWGTGTDKYTISGTLIVGSESQ